MPSETKVERARELVARSDLTFSERGVLYRALDVVAAAKCELHPPCDPNYAYAEDDDMPCDTCRTKAAFEAAVEGALT